MIFDVAYSFVVGLVLLVVMLPFVGALSKSERRGSAQYILMVPVGVALCALQGAMIAVAVVVALQLDAGRSDMLWYILGLCFSAPIAMIRASGTGDPEQQLFRGVGILASIITYIAVCVFPQYTPPSLANTSVRWLLGIDVAVDSPGSRSAANEDIRETLASAVERMNRQIAAAPFLESDCPSGDGLTGCLELFRVDLRNDLGIDRHYRVHFPGKDLDVDERTREAIVQLFGLDESSYGFYKVREDLCRGEALRLMREEGLKIGVIYHTVGGMEITRCVVDLPACLDWFDLKEFDEP